LRNIFTAPAFAAQVNWVDWTSSPNQFSASGNLHVGSTLVNVDYSGTGAHSFVQTGSGTNYWTGSAYTNGTIVNAPPASELVALNQGGTVTIHFSEPVLDPFIGLVSWNSNTVDFGTPIHFDSFGSGYWGNGTPTINAAGTGFFGSGEVHGVIGLDGTYSFINFSHTSENWHGFTVGVAGLPSPVPLPAAVWLFGSGIASIIGLVRMNKNREKVTIKDV
jgi:hypothetical protein